MSLDPEDVQRVRDTATAFVGMGAAGALLWRISKAVRDRTCAGLAWAQNWAAVPGRVARMVDATEERFSAVAHELATLGTHVGMSLDARGLAQWRCDPQGNARWVSPGYVRLTGRSEVELLGRGWIGTVHPEDREVGVEEWLLSVGDRRAWEGRYRVVRPDGAVIDVHAISSPVLLGDRCVGFVGVLQRADEQAWRRRATDQAA